MKEIMDADPGQSSEKDNFANRKLIRPTLPRVENYNTSQHSPDAAGATRAAGAA